MGIQKVESDRLQSRVYFRRGHNIWQAVPDHDGVLDPLMLGVAEVENHPSGTNRSCKTCAGAQDAKNLPVQFCLVRCVGRGFDSVNGIIVIVFLGNMHEISLDEAAEGTDVFGMHFRALDLISVVVDAYYIGPEWRAILSIGPPTPQPKSRTCIPGLSAALSAMKCWCLSRNP